MDYRRMGNMKHQLGNMSSTTLLHQLRDLWKSPRRLVLRIEALAILAIVITFLLAAFGSCRRWSNRWIVQKGFLAANVLSLSLGTYSIGLMQSSSVKSEMYPIWTMSLFALFGCVDSVTTYCGVDYKSPLLKMVFQLCLYFGYVLLMSFSTISSDIGKIAISVMSAITFFKSFHRSLAFVLPRRVQNVIKERIGDNGDAAALGCPRNEHFIYELTVDFEPWCKDRTTRSIVVGMSDILWACTVKGELQSDVDSCYDVCFAFSLSHMLQRRFLGFNQEKAKYTGRWCSNFDVRWCLKVIEVELAFLYDTFFTGNAFIYYYQAKASCLWTFASFIGICFVGVHTAISGTMTSHGSTTSIDGVDTITVDTTTADIILTLVILVSLALLQLLQLIWCWTSNWARVAFACKYVRTLKKGSSRLKRYWWWMRLKAFVVTRSNWFGSYLLWQYKLGQYSVVEGSSRRKSKSFSNNQSSSVVLTPGVRLYWKFVQFLQMFGLQYIRQVLQELWGSGTKTQAAVRLHDDVRASIADFLGKINNEQIDEQWLALLVANGVQSKDLPYNQWYKRNWTISEHSFMDKAMEWHIATYYCELVEQEKEHTECRETAASADCFRKAAAAVAGCFKKAAAAAAAAWSEKERRGGRDKEVNHRRVAIALSKYWAYLLVAAPELLPGSSKYAQSLHNSAASKTRAALHGTTDKLMAMQKGPTKEADGSDTFWNGVDLGKRLLESERCSDPWKVLALLWVQTMLFAAPYGDAEAHMQHLSQGGEFITHLWALLYHMAIVKWEPSDKKVKKRNN
ncbi:hypothetical protein ACP70R_042055 [Stipagrostis hirtigluma subsp. patula]